MNPAAATSSHSSPAAATSPTHTDGGNLARSSLIPSGPFLFEQLAKLFAQIGCGSAADLLPAPVARARRGRSGFSRESRPQIFVEVNHLTHVDGSLGCIRNHNRSAFA